MMALLSVVTNLASGIAFWIASRKPFMRPWAQNWAGSPPETAKTLRWLPLESIHFSTISAAVAPSFIGTWVKLVNSWPREVTPTVKTGMPRAIILLVMAVTESEVVGSMAMQSMAPAASLASIWETCWLGSVCTGAIGVQSMG